MRIVLLLMACSSPQSNVAGTVDLFSVIGPPVFGAALANFPDSFDIETGCVATIVGPCHVYDCSNEKATPMQPRKNVGTVQFSVAGKQVAKLDYSSGKYSPSDLTPPVWKSTDLLEFDVGTQAIIKMSAPDPITVTAPVLPYSADLTKPLPLTWSGGTKGVSVVIRVGASATCTLPSETTSADIPAALVTVPAGGVTFYGYTARIVDLNGTTARAYTDLYGADGAELNGSLTPK